MRARLALVVCVLTLDTACASVGAGRNGAIAPDARADAVARAQVWRPVATSKVNIARGPQGRGAFAPNQLVTCTYLPKELGGRTPKFACTGSIGPRETRRPPPSHRKLTHLRRTDL